MLGLKVEKDHALAGKEMESSHVLPPLWEPGKAWAGRETTDPRQKCWAGAGQRISNSLLRKQWGSPKNVLCSHREPICSLARVVGNSPPTFSQRQLVTPAQLVIPPNPLWNDFWKDKEPRELFWDKGTEWVDGPEMKHRKPKLSLLNASFKENVRMKT